MMSARRNGVIASYIELISVALSGFIYVPMLISHLSTSEYGLYRLVGSLMIYFYFLDFGLSTIITRFYVALRLEDDHKKIENFLFMAILFCGAVSCMVSLLAGGMYFFLDEFFQAGLTDAEITQAKMIFLVLIFNLFIIFWKNFEQAVLGSYEKFVLLKLFSALQVIVQQIAVFFVIQYISSAFYVVVTQTIVTVAALLYYFVYIRTHFHITIKFHFFDFALFRQMGKLSVSLVLITLASQVFLQGGQIFLGAELGTAAVAVYSVAVTIYTNYAPLADRITNVFLPYLTKVAVAGDFQVFNKEMKEVGRFQSYILFGVLSAFLILGKAFIAIWATTNMADAYYFAICIMIPLTIKALQSMCGTILQSLNRVAFQAGNYLICALLYIGLMPWVIRIYGSLGCAIFTGIMIFICDGVIMSYYYGHNLKLDMIGYLKSILPIMAVASICALLFQTIFDITGTNKLWFTCQCLLYLVLYFLMMYFCVFNGREKESMKQILGKLKLVKT